MHGLAGNWGIPRALSKADEARRYRRKSVLNLTVSAFRWLFPCCQAGQNSKESDDDQVGLWCIVTSLTFPLFELAGSVVHGIGRS